MKIWTIKITRKGQSQTPCTDYHDGFVICAEMPKRVREIAAKNCGDEGEEMWTNGRLSHVYCIGTTNGYRTDGIIMESYCGS